MAEKVVRKQGLVITKMKYRAPVVETRAMVMPDGNVLLCRRRETAGGISRWTAEIPLDEAKKLYATKASSQDEGGAE
jgi:hypothetical protein